MPSFAFTELVPTEGVESGCLGPNSSTKFADADLGKAIKFGTADNFVLATEGDEIDGFVYAIDAMTYNSGFSFGSVQRKGRKLAVVGANQGGTPMAVGDYVVADAQVALGTAGSPKVKTGVAFAQSGTTPFAVTMPTPLHNLWRCIKIVSGTGVAGDTVLLERL